MTITLWEALGSLDESVAAAEARGATPLGLFDIDFEDSRRTTAQALRQAMRHFQGSQLAAFMFHMGVTAGYRLCQLRKMEEEVKDL